MNEKMSFEVSEVNVSFSSNLDTMGLWIDKTKNHRLPPH
jgi:hypothetical protein